MNMRKILKLSKLNEDQLNIIDEIFTQGKYDMYNMIGRALTIVAAGAMYAVSYKTFGTDLWQSIAYAILGTHVLFRNINTIILTAISYGLKNNGQRLREVNNELSKMQSYLAKQK